MTNARCLGSHATLPGDATLPGEPTPPAHPPSPAHPAFPGNLTGDDAKAVEEALALHRRGNTAAAIAHLAGAIATHPENATLRIQRGNIQLQVGRYRLALGDFVAGLERQPDEVSALQGLAWCLARRPHLVLQLNSTTPLLAALESEDVDPDLVAQGGWALVRHADLPLDDPLVLALLERALVADLNVERRLVEARRQLCLEPPTQPTSLAGALAKQGALNEFVWPVSSTEAEQLPTAPHWVQRMYNVPDPDPDLLARAAAIPTLTGVASANSSAVQDMYERNPYPRWQRFNRTKPIPLSAYLRQLTEGQFEPPPFLDAPAMLVAGCGTGREMLSAASSWQPASVTGFDLSRNSLAYAHAMAERLGISADVYQADLTDIEVWHETFDVIVCTGVLHHLEDPIAGWHRLRRLLRPGGVMLIGLYSQLARAGISAAQQELAGFAPSVDGIRQSREHLMSLPDGHPARGAMVLRDFFYTSGCRDMLFHVQEHQFTITRLADALDAVGLEFLAFDVDGATREVHRTLFGTTTNLMYWDTYEQLYPDTFLGMYQFWCQRPQ